MNASDFMIREAGPCDAFNLLEYYKIVGEETDNITYGSEGISLSIEEEKELLEIISKSDKSIFLLVEYDNEIIGVGNISEKKSKRMAHKARLGITVRKKYWNKGIGNKLMATLINFAKKKDLELIELTVRSDNQRAINLYKKFNFKKTGIFPADLKIDGKYFDSYYMVLDLR